MKIMKIALHGHINRKNDSDDNDENWFCLHMEIVIIMNIIMKKMILPLETAASSRDSVSITLFFVMYWIVCTIMFLSS